MEIVFATLPLPSKGNSKGTDQGSSEAAVQQSKALPQGKIVIKRSIFLYSSLFFLSFFFFYILATSVLVFIVCNQAAPFCT